MKLVKKPRLTIALFIILFFIVVTISFLVLSNIFSQKQKEILLVKRDLAVTEVEKEFTEVEAILNSLAFYVKSDLDLHHLENTLIELEASDEMIAQMYFGMPDKTYIITSDFDEPGFDLTSRPWYQTAINSGEMAYTDAYIDAFYGASVMSIVLPVYDDSEVLIGVFGVDILVDMITSFISDFIDEDKGYIFMIDDYGHVLAHTNLKENINYIENYTTYDIPVEEFNDPRGMTTTIESKGSKGKIAYSTIGQSNYIIGIFMTQAELNQSIRTLTLTSLSILALVIAILVVTLGIYNRFVNKPLRALINDINQIDISKDSVFRLDAGPKASFRDARIALNNIIDISKKYQVELEESLDELSLENQKFQHLLSSTSDIVFMVDKDLKFVNIYGDISTIFSIEKKDIIGKSHEEVFGVSDTKLRDDYYQRALNGEKIIYSWQSKDPSTQKIKYIENVINPVCNHKNEIIGIVGVSRDITEQENRYKQLVYISTHDYLTDLNNRKVYDETIKDLNSREEFPYASINLDLNGLKLINDAYGHEYGDIALIKTAEILQECARDIDTVCRVSGDEFSVIMPQVTKKEVEAFRSKMKLMASQTKINNIELSIASGYFIQKDNSVSLDEVKRLAENDMYREKMMVKNKNKNNIIPAIYKTLTEKYDYEKRHGEVVMELSVEIGEELALDVESIEMLAKAAKFHDIGKVSLPEEILNKKEKLTKKEYEIIMSHTTIGYDILNTATEYSKVAICAASHHEHYDGNGYPNGLKGQQIPLFSRIIAVAETYEFLTSSRPYHKAMTKKQAIKRIEKLSGSQFDPEIVKVFIEKVIK